MDIKSKKDFESFLLQNFQQLKLMIFLSNSIESSSAVEEILRENLKEFQENKISVAFIKDDFEGHEEIFNQFSIEFVPSVIALNANFTVLEKFENFSPGELFLKSQKLVKTFQQSFELECIKYKQTLNRVFINTVFILFEFLKDELTQYEEIKTIIESKQLTSRRQSTMPFKEKNLLVIIGHLGYFFKNSYSFFIENKLPVVFFDKELIYDSKQLEEVLIEKKEIIETLKKTEENNVKSAIANNKVLLFTNSDDQNFKEQDEMLKLLQTKKVMYTYLDIASRPGIYGVLKKLFNLESLKLCFLVIEGKTHFQHDELLKHKSTGFQDVIPKKYIVESVDDRIKLILSLTPVVLFIKGSPEFPQCGFTRQVVELMTSNKVKFSYYNIMADAELKERLPIFSNWQTYPQVFVNSELIGGIDIVRELIEVGQFNDTFKAGMTIAE